MPAIAESVRLEESRQMKVHWNRWGPYLSERAWGTVREDYSPHGTAWEYFPHDHARSRAYRWNEDGIAGICDRHQVICFALALWNERDPILKERMFGLTGNEGNHGEDVKEYFFYLDNTPTHSYMRYLYKYPQRAYPYANLVAENHKRTKDDPEYELFDTGVFDESRYFDVTVEYAKLDADDLFVRIRADNRGPAAAPLHVLPTLWLRNTWSWGRSTEPAPVIVAMGDAPAGTSLLQVETSQYGPRWLYADQAPAWMFTENNSNVERLWGVPRNGQVFKDGINDAIVSSRVDTIAADGRGTKAAAHYRYDVPAGGSVEIRLRLTDKSPGEMPPAGPFDRCDETMALRLREADEFYATVIPDHLSVEARRVMRQAFAGLLWSKQFYHYIVREWLDGDPASPPPPRDRLEGRNSDWVQLYNADVISMPDKWEYPWYATWDLGFHCVALALIDPEFAKSQLTLFLREWYMHPSGQLPAYEWALDDVNPPVHAWAVLRVYQIERRRTGKGDRLFLERAFHKLLLNFTWWVNRKDAEGNNVFQGGFLGLDNIGVFDRSKPLPTGGILEQSDGTSWMAAYSITMLAIAFELADENPAYEDVASKFWEHFLYIANAMSSDGGRGIDLWDEDDGFFYDVLHVDGLRMPLKVRSMVGLIPIIANATLEPKLLARMPGFKRRLDWFVENRPDLVEHAASMTETGMGERRLLSIVDQDQLRRILKVMLDPNEFLSDHGIRALSRRHIAEPYRLQVDGIEYTVGYEPAESRSGLFGGNSNWRGPVWFPANLLLIEGLQRYHYYYGDEFTVECPTGSGQYLTLGEVAQELSRRLTRIFLPEEGRGRPVNGSSRVFQEDPHWRDLVLFYEYFNGETGEGLGASHQTGWTALVAKLLQQSGE
jgi:hypothetical protein